MSAHAENDATALVGPHGIIWRFNHHRRFGKPHFHPLALANGKALTTAQPDDHVWHYGLWFSWKFINGINYWEEHPHAGQSKGRTSWSDVEIQNDSDGAARIAMTLDYHPPGHPPVLTERRTVRISAPGTDGSYKIDWHCEHTARVRLVTLDRTPPPGEENGRAWGGYAGLSIRLADQMHDVRCVTTHGPVTFEQGAARQAAEAVDYSGIVNGEEGGIALFDASENLRHPTPWYIIHDRPMRYVNAAILHDAPLEMHAGQSLRLRYRLVVHPGRWDRDSLVANVADL